MREEIKKLKADNELLAARWSQLQISRSDREKMVQELTVDAEVRKYTETVFTQLPTTNPSLLAEYDSLKKSSAAAMKLARLYPDHDGAKKMVSNFEGRALQLQVQSVNPKLAQKMAFVESNPLWKQNMGKLKWQIWENKGAPREIVEMLRDGVSVQVDENFKPYHGKVNLSSWVPEERDWLIREVEILKQI